MSPEQPIATFDQDGTLWVEHPVYSQVVYCLDRVPALAEKNRKLKDVEPFKTVLSGNREAIAKWQVPVTRRAFMGSRFLAKHVQVGLAGYLYAPFLTHYRLSLGREAIGDRLLQSKY